MASRTSSKIVAAKRAFAIVTGQATLPIARGVMMERLGLRYLPPLWHAGANLMTRVASSIGVLRVTETYSK